MCDCDAYSRSTLTQKEVNETLNHLASTTAERDQLRAEVESERKAKEEAIQQRDEAYRKVDSAELQISELKKAAKPVIERMTKMLDPLDCGCEDPGHSCGFPAGMREVEALRKACGE